MLVLSIAKNETVTIFTSDGDIVVTNVETRSNGAMTLGFDAPKKIKIYRTELLDQRIIK